MISSFLVALLTVTSSGLLPFNSVQADTGSDVGPLMFAHHWPKTQKGIPFRLISRYNGTWLDVNTEVLSGETTEILVSMLNTGEVPQNIHHISAAFANPSDFTQIWRNVGKFEFNDW